MAAVLLLVLLASASLGYQPFRFVPGQVLVQIRPGLPEPDSVVARLVMRLSSRRWPLRIKSVWRLNPRPVGPEESVHRWYVLTLRDRNTDVLRLVQALERDSLEVEHAEPNWIYTIAERPRTPHEVPTVHDTSR